MSPNASIVMTEDCQIIPNVCVETIGFKTAVVKYKIWKNNLVVLQGTINACDALSKVNDDIKAIMKMFAIPSKCPFEAVSWDFVISTAWTTFLFFFSARYNPTYTQYENCLFVRMNYRWRSAKTARRKAKFSRDSASLSHSLVAVPSRRKSKSSTTMDTVASSRTLKSSKKNEHCDNYQTRTDYTWLYDWNNRHWKPFYFYVLFSNPDSLLMSSWRHQLSKSWDRFF